MPGEWSVPSDGKGQRSARPASAVQVEVTVTPDPPTGHSQRLSSPDSAHGSAGFENMDKETCLEGQPSGEVAGTADKRAGGGEDAEPHTSAPCCIFIYLQNLKSFLHQYRGTLGGVVKAVLVLLWVCYTCYALYRQWGSEAATRLWLVLAVVVWAAGGRRGLEALYRRLPALPTLAPARAKTLRTGVRWFLYIVAVVGGIAYLALEVAPHNPSNLLSLAGIACLLFVALLLSTRPLAVNWHAVFWGMSLQFYLAIFLLRTTTGSDIFRWLGDRIEEFIAFTDQGSKFIFGDAYTMHPFVFRTMPVVIFVNSVIAIAYYFHVVQAIIATFGRFLSVCLKTTPIESVNAAANVFLGLTEAPLFIQPFLGRVSQSELFAIMTGGFASIAGAIMASLVAFGIPANHLLAASVMSAPAALAVAKLMCPEETEATKISAKEAYDVEIEGSSHNLLEAVSRAAVGGVSIAVTVCANILIFIAILAVLDAAVEWFAEQAGVDNLSFSRLLSYPFYPLLYLCGVDNADLLTLGRLVGVKILTNTQLGYKQLADVIANSRVFEDYKQATNGTWRHQGQDLLLGGGGVLTERSIVMSTYIMCGFSNVSSMGMCIGTLTALAPQRSRDVLTHVLRAAIAGNMACFLTGCVAGLLYL